jgi:hypothetical protein
LLKYIGSDFLDPKSRIRKIPMTTQQLKKAYLAREELKAKIKLQYMDSQELEKIENQQQSILFKSLEKRDENNQILTEIDALLEEATTRSIDVSREARQRDEKRLSMEKSKRSRDLLEERLFFEDLADARKAATVAATTTTPPTTGTSSSSAFTSPFVPPTELFTTTPKKVKKKPGSPPATTPIPLPTLSSLTTVKRDRTTPAPGSSISAGVNSRSSSRRARSGAGCEGARPNASTTRLQVLVGSIEAGNRGKALSKQVMEMSDELLIAGKLSKSQHKQIYDRYVKGS